jgi:uncharacterized iron-regulated membrane protein
VDPTDELGKFFVAMAASLVTIYIIGREFIAWSERRNWKKHPESRGSGALRRRYWEDSVARVGILCFYAWIIMFPVSCAYYAAKSF